MESREAGGLSNVSEADAADPTTSLKRLAGGCENPMNARAMRQAVPPSERHKLLPRHAAGAFESCLEWLS